MGSDWSNVISSRVQLGLPGSLFLTAHTAGKKEATKNRYIAGRWFLLQPFLELLEFRVSWKKWSGKRPWGVSQFGPAPGVALPHGDWVSEVYLAKQTLAVHAEVEGENLSLPICVNNGHEVKHMEPLDMKALLFSIPLWCADAPHPSQIYSSLPGCDSLEELLTGMGWNQMPHSAQIPSFKQATDLTLIWYHISNTDMIYHIDMIQSGPLCQQLVLAMAKLALGPGLPCVYLYTSVWGWAVWGRKELKSQSGPNDPFTTSPRVTRITMVAGVGRAGSSSLSLLLAEPDYHFCAAEEVTSHCVSAGRAAERGLLPVLKEKALPKRSLHRQGIAHLPRSLANRKGPSKCSSLPNGGSFSLGGTGLMSLTGIPPAGRREPGSLAFLERLMTSRAN